MVSILPKEARIEEVWQKARPAPGRDPRLYRISPDIIQSIIRRDQYNVCGEYGWRIEHGKPVSYRNSSIEQAMKIMQNETFVPHQTAKHNIKQ
ncbi:MAG: hypothetical protein OEY16_10610 [Alphaproteobacteria bacterium]|nr:hypothetical protein [Alphaproteobacteria bacterium]